MDEKITTRKEDIWKAMLNYISAFESRLLSVITILITLASGLFVYGYVNQVSIVFYIVPFIILIMANYYSGLVESINIAAGYCAFLEESINKEIKAMECH
jgi:fatty-acid desaturase